MYYQRPVGFNKTACLAAIGLFAVSLPARAAELDRYLPADSQIVINVNVRQLLDSELVKTQALEMLREALKSVDQAEEILKDLGFDPFKDLDRVVIAAPGDKEPDRGLLIVRGRFDPAKIKAKAEDVAKTHDEILRIVKIPDGKGGNLTVWQVSPPETPTPLFVSLADGNTLVASAGKDYVVDALRKFGRKEPVSLKDKEFEGLLKTLDDKQSLSFAAVSAAIGKSVLAGAGGQAGDALTKITALGGGVTLSEDIKVEIVVSAKNAAEAKEFRDTADSGIKLALGLLAAMSQGAEANPGLELALEVVKGLKIQVKDKTIILKGRISGETITDAFKKIK
jgi:hypothetical protein